MKKFTYTLEIEVPSEKAMEMNDEWLISGLMLHPFVCTSAFDGIKISILDIKREDGSSLSGYPREDDIKEYVRLTGENVPLQYSLQLVEKSRKEKYEQGIHKNHT